MEVDEALKSGDMSKICDLLERPIKRVAYGLKGEARTNVVLTLGELGVIVAEHVNDSLIAHWLPAACLNTELAGPLWYLYYTLSLCCHLHVCIL